MRRKHLVRALGFVLSVLVATTNLATSVYAAEPVILEEELPDDAIADDSVEEQPEVGDDVSNDDIEAVLEEPEEVVEEEGTDPVEPIVEENVAAEEVNEDVTSEENEESIPVTTLGSAEEVTVYLEQHPSNGTRLVLYSETAVNDFYGAVEAVSYDGLWMITYSDNEACNRAYESYMAIGYEVDLDSAVDNHEDDTLIEDLTPEDVPEESVEVQTEDTKDVIEEEELSIEKDVVVAIIDTGVDVEDELLKERLVEGISEEMADANGHGTVMAEIVASQTGENVKILPIAAFDENGKSTVAKVYFAIEDAIRADVDVINISASGLGESKVLTHAVADAKNAGIPVIVAAGNDAADTKDYMPGNVLDAITISATDKEQAFAEYSNFGENVDFSAIGILVKDMGTEDEADDLVYMGTSISSAYVSSYAALLISEYKEEEFDVDVFESFLASAIDLGDEGYDVYYGNGFLDKEHIVAVIKEKREALEGEEEDITEELEEEGDMELESAYSLYSGGREFNSQCYSMVGQTTVNYYTFGAPNDYAHLHIGTNTSAESHSIKFCQNSGYNPSGPWRQGTAVYSRNPADGVTLNGCVFYNCWIENFFDVTYNNCTFYNCTFSNNGGQNTVRFNYCNVNPNGYTPGGVTQASPTGPRDHVYAGILGGNNTHWILNGTTVNGTGAIAAVSNCVQSANPASTDIINGSRVYGATYGVDAWQWYSTNQTIRIDSSSVVEGNSVGIYNTGNLTVQNGAIRNNGNCGVENAGTATINGGTMTGNGTAVVNGGTLTQNGGSIINNTNGVSNTGTYVKAGGDVKANRGWGIINNGGATHLTSGNISENASGGIYQNATLYMNGNGEVKRNNAIYLTPGHIIHVNGALNSAQAGTILTGEGDRATGRQLVSLYAEDTSVGENVANKFNLGFSLNDNAHTQDVYYADGTRFINNGQKVSSLIRAGYGSDQNASANQVILSGLYFSNYESNLEGLDGMKISVPYTFNTLRYGEKYLPDTPSHAYTTGEINDPTVTVTMKDGSTKDITKSLCFKGWALDANEMDESKIFTTDQVLAMYGDFHWYAIWDARFDVYFDGNKQNTGENYRVDDLNLWKPLPGNVGPNGDKKNYFTKEDVYKASEKTWYDENREEFIDLTIPYSYQGWSLRDDAKYNDKDVVNPKDESRDTLGEALGIGNYSTGVKWLIEKIKDEETMGFDEDGRAIVPMYVVWDKAPVIGAYDIYVTPKDIDSMSDDDLWKNVTATDREDGTLKNKVDVTVIDFNPDDLKDIKGDRGGVSITYRAEDGAGNVTFYDVMINVISNRAVTSWTTNEDGSRRDTANYVRFIDRENYNKSSMKDGGMEEHSVWYTNPEYVKEITQAFNHLDNETSIVSYKLDLKTMQNIQAYNKAHFGEVLETSFRTNFYEQFCKPNVIYGSLPTSETARE